MRWRVGTVESSRVEFVCHTDLALLESDNFVHGGPPVTHNFGVGWVEGGEVLVGESDSLIPV